VLNCWRMTDTRWAPLSDPSTGRDPVRPRAAIALASLLRAASARGWAVGTARACGWLIAAVTVACVVIIARPSGPDAAVLSLVAHAAATVAHVAGGVAALALSARATDDVPRAAFVALARARWLADGDLVRGELLACVEILTEVVALPVVALAVLAFAVAARAELGRWAFALGGAVAFSALAAVLLGVVAGACRHWGGAAGRRWFVAAIAGPVLLSEAMGHGSAGQWLSIPGALAQLWEALTATAS
jgi:hypothetical protein